MALLLEPPRLPLVDDDEELLCDEELFQLWLNNCHGTGIIFPWALWVPPTLERLEGTVSLPEVEVSEELPPDARERMANSIRPL